MTHICVVKLTSIGSDNGLSPRRRQAIIWTNAGILLIGPLGTNFSEISIKILTFSYTKMRLKVSSAKWRPVCLGLNVLKDWEGPNTIDGFPYVWYVPCLIFVCILRTTFYLFLILNHIFTLGNQNAQSRSERPNFRELERPTYHFLIEMVHEESMVLFLELNH